MKRHVAFALTVIGILVLASASVACSGNDDAAPAPATATPTTSVTKPGEGTPTSVPPTASPTRPGGDFNECPDSSSLCAHATYLTVKFEAKDFAAVAREFVPHNVTCKADYGQGLDADASVCREKAAGTIVVAFNAGRTYSEGYRTTAEGLEALLRDYATGADATVSDDYGSGAFRMYSIGKRDCPDCRNKRTLVYSRILKLEPIPGAGPRYIRDVMMLSLASQGSGPEVWRVEIVLTGLQLGVDIPARLGGGSHPDGSLYTVWNPREGMTPAGKGPIWLGATVEVKVGGDCLNVRKEPSKAAAVVTCLKDREMVQVTGPAKEGDGLKWWPVQVIGPGALAGAGWASSEFLALTVR